MSQPISALRILCYCSLVENTRLNKCIVRSLIKLKPMNSTMLCVEVAYHKTVLPTLLHFCLRILEMYRNRYNIKTLRDKTLP